MILGKKGKKRRQGILKNEVLTGLFLRMPHNLGRTGFA